MNLSYCDRIAAIIKEELPKDQFGLITKTGPINMDLHPTEGYFLSTKKTMSVTDRNGKSYMITVEEV
jgi:hypothetical protein